MSSQAPCPSVPVKECLSCILCPDGFMVHALLRSPAGPCHDALSCPVALYLVGGSP